MLCTVDIIAAVILLAQMPRLRVRNCMVSVSNKLYICIVAVNPSIHYSSSVLIITLLFIGPSRLESRNSPFKGSLSIYRNLLSFILNVKSSDIGPSALCILADILNDFFGLNCYPC